MLQIYAIYKGHILIQTQNQMEIERMKEDKSKQKRDLVAMLLSDKIYFKSKCVTRDKMVLYTDTGSKNTYSHTRATKGSQIYEKNIGRNEGRNIKFINIY